MTELPADYKFWKDAAGRLLDPLIRLMDPEGSEIPLSPWASDHDANADRLEAFARPCFLAALWLQSVPSAEEAEKRGRVAAWFRQALLRGSDPDSSLYWGPNTNYHQNGVEIGLLICGLLLAREQLWDPFTEAEKRQIGHWVASNRATGHHWNNHMFFGILALEFLREVGMDRPSDQAAIKYWFSEMETMYRGGGWFMDGMNQSYDHYNAYAFHFYGLLWSHLFKGRDSVRRERWCHWASEFLNEYQYSFAASGEHPAFGRSITYRFNATAPFSLASLLGVSPLPPGRARRLCTRNLKFFLGRAVTQDQGALALGWHDEFPELAERYSCAGSVYWAAKAFVTLLVPPDHDFWTCPEEALPSEAGDFVRPQKAAGLIFRGVGGEVEWLNAGTEITPVNMPKFGPWKWGKLAYRTGVGFQIGQTGDYYGKLNGYYSKDGGMTMEGGRDDRIHGRHYTLPLEITDTYFGCTYALGDKVDQLVTVVESYVWWKAGWLLQVHMTESYQAVRLNLGGYALSSVDPGSFRKDRETGFLRVSSDGRISALQTLCGFDGTEWDERLDDSRPRSHVQAPYHVTPVAFAGRNSGERTLACLVFAGTDNGEAMPWTVVHRESGNWKFNHPKLGEWEVSHSFLPAS